MSPEARIPDEGPKTPSALLDAIRSGDAEALRAQLDERPELAASRTEEGVRVLLFALYNGQTELAALLRAQRSTLDLHEAAATGDLHALDEALEGAELDARSADGFTPLHLACFFGHARAARVLLARGADVDAVASNGSELRPIHSAAASRSAALVRITLTHGADPDAQQSGGFTALHAAAKHGDEAMAIALLAHGADPAIRSDDDQDAEAFARSADATRIRAAIARAR